MEKKNLSTDKKDELIQVNVRIPASVHMELEHICDGNRPLLDKSKIIRYAIDRYLNESKQTNDYGLSDLLKIRKRPQEVLQEEEPESPERTEHSEGRGGDRTDQEKN